MAQLEGDEPFELILCDVSMGEISGIDLHQLVCDHYSELAGRFMFLTGGATDEATDAYLRNSGVPVLEKPVERSAFEKALATLSGG